MLNIAGAIIVAVNLAFTKSQSCCNAPYQMPDIEAAQFGLESLPLNFRTIVVIRCKFQQVCTELVHVLLIDERGHDVERVFMNGIQFLLLAFCLTLIKVINALLIGRAGMAFFCEYSCLCHTYIFCNLSLDYLFSCFSLRKKTSNSSFVMIQ